MRDPPSNRASYEIFKDAGLTGNLEPIKRLTKLTTLTLDMTNYTGKLDVLQNLTQLKYRSSKHVVSKPPYIEKGGGGNMPFSPP